jgi:hypothetical protein
MPLPSSGPLSLNDIQTEFGGVNPISLSEYYAGGGLVPPGTTGTFGAVPTVGNPISIQNFYGTSNVVYRLDDAFYSDTGLLNFFPAEVAFYVNSNGTIEAATFGSGIIDSYNWITPTTGSTTYFVRATLTSGSFTTGTTGTWLALTSSHTWTIQLPENVPDFQSANATFAIATDSGGTNIVVSANISLQATVS